MTAGGASGNGPQDACVGGATALTFHAMADPQCAGSSGTRAFAINQVGSVWEDTLGSGNIPTIPLGKRRTRPCTPIQ